MNKIIKRILTILTIHASIYMFAGFCLGNDVIDSNLRLPKFDSDKRGMKVPPVVVYNATTGNYETVYLLTDASGALSVSLSGSSTSTLITSDIRYDGKVSSGTSGILTGVTTGSIVITDNVASWSFLYIDNTNPSTLATVQPSIWGTNMYFINTVGHDETVTVPAPVTFTYSLSVEATMFYDIEYLK